MFSEEELAFLREQPLARIGTVDDQGQPTVDAVGFEFDGTRFYIGGHRLEVTRKYKNIVAGHHQVSLLIDDLKSLRPWQPRGIRIHGVAESVQHQGHLGAGSYLAITPRVSWSWGMQEPGVEAGKGGPKKVLWSSPKTASGESQ